MRKKSHVLLGSCLAKHLDSRELKFHKKTFIWGNVLPDFRPSFVTVRHEYHVNFDMVCDMIRNLTEECYFLERYTSKYWRTLGEVSHYVADYFVFPHNAHYNGNIVDHTLYEGDLMKQLRTYIRSGMAKEHLQNDISKEVVFEDFEDIISFIKKEHDKYAMKDSCVEEDIQYIVSMCYQVTQGVIQVMEAKFAAQPEVVFA